MLGPEHGQLTDGHHCVIDPRSRLRYDECMAIAPHLEPDPFDKEIDTLLADPNFVAELDRRRARRAKGEATLYTNEEVRQHLLKRGVPVDSEPASDA